MILKKVTIDNFRNIKHAEYDLKKINMMTGPNQTGKTNTILAVYWAITDFLIDGSSDFASFKPLSDTSKEVSVELEFDEFTLKKTFAEHWTKTRGSSETLMTGHDTTYWINGSKVSITAAKKDLANKFGVDKFDSGKFDLLRGIVDPYYFGKTCDWKTLRAFIISICGDVSNEDIFNAEPNLLPIKERLQIDKFDTGKTATYFKQQLRTTIDGITENNGKIAGLDEIKDPSESDLNHATEEIKRIDKSIADLKSGNGTENLIDELNKQLQEAKLSLRESQANDRDKYAADNKELSDKINAKQNEVNESVKNATEILSNDIAPVDRKLADLKSSLNSFTYMKDANEKKRTELLSKYDSLDAWVAPEGAKCPHCGGILNQDYIDNAIAEHQKQLDECIADGKKAAAEIENNGIKIKEIENNISEIKRNRLDAEDRYKAAQDHTELLRKELSALNCQVNPDKPSEATQKAAEKVEHINEQIRNEYLKQSSDEDSIKDAVRELESQKLPFQQTIDAHAAYRLNQSRIADIKKDIDSAQKEQIKLEQKIQLIEKYIQTKLRMFEKNISSVFGEHMKFTLIQNNIKEGSWNEVCIPMIVDKDTPFLDGSGSEQIITGIYFAECVKKKIGIPDLPFIFDECDKLDGAHLAAIKTNSQILSTIVDDQNYTAISMISRGE